MYCCKPCDAWVGVHRGTDKALGRLANKELRDWKVEAHKYFDPLWQRKMQQGYSKTQARRMAYGWLAEKMGISIKVAHIGMFDVNQCKQVVELCKPYNYEQASRNKPDHQST